MQPSPGASPLATTSFQFTATLYYSNGQKQVGQTSSGGLQWSTDEPALVTVNNGLVTAVATDSPTATADVIATDNGSSGSAVVTVTNQGNLVVGVN